MSDQSAATDAAAAAAVSAHASKATYTGSGLSIFGGLTLNEAAIVVGMLTAILGLAVQWYYKHRSVSAQIRHMEAEDARRQAEHEERMRDRDEQ